ncbi:uncharacterized protein LOC112687068 [Sipha flava]|uniref:Uncharacterized protein LOC112687068 n=1 Tax=Sipha flava TaxID=143950 RepID=A0A8B8FX35_9HEMI|nr:uncharacterized protein LOC112687068 [Sipha flava]
MFFGHVIFLCTVFFGFFCRACNQIYTVVYDACRTSAVKRKRNGINNNRKSKTYSYRLTDHKGYEDCESCEKFKLHGMYNVCTHTAFFLSK